MFGLGKVSKEVKFRRKMAKKLHGMHLKYVMERLPDEDDIIVGREGALIVRDDDFIVFSSQKDVFRSKIDETDFSELMSLGGVIITGLDIISGRERSVIAHYTDRA
jgi:hypothetical protein